MSLLTGFGGEAMFVDELLAVYPPRIADAREFALARRVLLVRSQSGIGIDISLAALPFEAAAAARAVAVEMIPGRMLRLCCAENLFVMKVFAGRDTDLRDARSILVRQGARLNWSLIEQSTAELASLRDDRDLREEVRKLRT